MQFNFNYKANNVNIFDQIVPGLYFFIIAFVICVIAYIVVTVKMKKFSKIKVQSGLTGFQTAELILSANGLSRVNVQALNGKTRTNYDSRARTIELSSSIYYNSTMFAVCAAAHETGYAVEASEGRNSLPLTKLLSFISHIILPIVLPLGLLGLVINNATILNITFISFCIAILLLLITVPFEILAGKIGTTALKSTDVLTKYEYNQLKKMMFISSLTYLATGFTFFLLIFNLFDTPKRK